MATAVFAPKSVELFYSYAHDDELLCRELQKHLTALKRAGLISDWYDRKIEPGSEWAAEIQSAMERAGLILLLISADFLASKYIFEVELPFALKRHDAGLARVIPVLLRPVEWRDSPFAKLQILPSQARAVTLWPNPDQAFSDIAARLRELIYDQRLLDASPGIRTPASSFAADAQTRFFDAALASAVVLDEPTDLVAMFRTSESGGLKAILRLDRSYSAAGEDVKSNSLEIDFPTDLYGKPLPATVELALQAPGFDPLADRKSVRIPARGDSAVFVFMLTPKHLGTLRVNLQILAAGTVIGSQLLATKSIAALAAEPSVSYGVVSWPVAVPGPANPGIAAGSPPPLASPALWPGFETEPRNTGVGWNGGTRAFPSAAPKKSGRKLWLIAGSSAAAIAVALLTTTQFRTTNKVIPTYSTSAPSVGSRALPQPEAPETEDELRASLADMRTRAASIHNKATRPLPPALAAAQARLNSNLKRSDNALKAHQRTLAQKYFLAAQKDLNTLEAATP